MKQINPKHDWRTQLALLFDTIAQQPWEVQLVLAVGAAIGATISLYIHWKLMVVPFLIPMTRDLWNLLRVVPSLILMMILLAANGVLDAILETRAAWRQRKQP